MNKSIIYDLFFVSITCMNIMMLYVISSIQLPMHPLNHKKAGTQPCVKLEKEFPKMACSKDC